jgi:hypothetical protein
MRGMRSRRARMSAMAGAYTALVLVALAAIAVISARHGGRLDLTQERRHSLRPATRALVASIPKDAEPVDVLGVTSAGIAGGSGEEARAQLAPLLDLFAHESPKIRTSVRLAEKEPALVNELAIDRVPLVLLSWQPPTPPGGAKPERRQRRTLVATENGIAQALREILEDRKRIAYFLVGHGELRIGEGQPASAHLLALTMQGMNFETRELALAGSADIPQDADLVVVAGPQADLLKDEMAALDRYIARGGRFLVLDAPTREPGTLVLLNAWLSAQWNIGPTEGFVADFEVPLGADPRILLVMPKPGDHPICEGLQKLVQLPLSRSFSFLDRALDGVLSTPFLTSGPRSWIETDLAQSPPRFDEGTDATGPLALAFASTKRPTGQEREARLVVFGTRMAFADQGIGNAGNADLLRNAVDWATGHESDIAAREGDAPDGAVVIADRQGRVILGTMLFVPAVVALAGIATWWHRRRL